MGDIDAESHRRFYCARCHAVMVLCRRCDRGQRYCGPRCSEGARHESLRRAGRRHRRTVTGRQANAERQRRFRARRAADVTHQGHALKADLALQHERRCGARHRETPPTALPVATRVRPENGSRTTAPSSASAPGQRCSRCGCQCGRFTRWDCLSELRPRRRTPHPRPTPAR